MTQRDRIVVFVVAAVAALAAFWLLALSPKRKEAGRLGSDLAAAQARVGQADQSIAAARAAKATYRLDYATVARLGKAVPTDDDVPSLVYQLDSAAKRTGVDFRAVKLSSGGASSAPPTPAPTPAPTTGAPATGAPATQVAAATLPPGASVGPAGFPTMPFTFTFTGNFFRLSSFFHNLQRFIVTTRRQLRVSGRLLTVDGITLQPAESGFPRMTASVASTAYLLPADEGLTDGATPQTPSTAPGSAQPAAGSGGSAPTPVTATAAPAAR
jgi:hypothetical protein